MTSGARIFAALLLTLTTLTGCALSHGARPADRDSGPDVIDEQAVDVPVVEAGDSGDAGDAAVDAPDVIEMPDTPVIAAQPGAAVVAAGTVSESVNYRVVHSTGESTIIVGPANSSRYQLRGGLIGVITEGAFR